MQIIEAIIEHVSPSKSSGCTKVTIHLHSFIAFKHCKIDQFLWFVDIKSLFCRFFLLLRQHILKHEVLKLPKSWVYDRGCKNEKVCEWRKKQRRRVVSEKGVTQSLFSSNFSILLSLRVENISRRSKSKVKGSLTLPFMLTHEQSIEFSLNTGVSAEKNANDIFFLHKPQKKSLTS